MRTTNLALLLLMGALAFGCKKNISSELKEKSVSSSDPNVSLLGNGTTYYVSATGDNTKDGKSIANAWQTISKVNSENYAPGDHVLFEGGKIFTGTIVATSSGSNGSYVHYGSYGSGRALINAGSGHGVFIYNKSNVWVDNLIVYGSWDENAQSGSTGAGIFYYNDMPGIRLGDCYVSECDVSGFKNSGIKVQSWSAGLLNGFNKVVIASNTVHNNAIDGIITVGSEGGPGSNEYAFSYVYVGLNKVYSNLGLKAPATIHNGNGILVGGAGSGLVEKNVAYNNGWFCKSPSAGPAGIWCYDSNGLIFQFNESYNNGAGPGTPDGDGFDFDGGTTNCIMQYNYSHDNWGAGYLLWEYGAKRGNNNGNIIRYNISENDAYQGDFYGSITLGPNCNNNKIYNNTIYSSYNPAVKIKGGSGTGLFNNIFYNNSSRSTVHCATGLSGAYFFNNNYYAGKNTISIHYNGINYTTLAAFRAATYNEVGNGGSAYGYSVNPLLNNPGGGGTISSGSSLTALNSYKLNAGSPMINAGFNLLSNWGINPGTKDFNWTAIPHGSGYDIGACEAK